MQISDCLLVVSVIRRSVAEQDTQRRAGLRATNPDRQLRISSI